MPLTTTRNSKQARSSVNDIIRMDRLRHFLTGRGGPKDIDANPDEYEPLHTSSDDLVEAGDTIQDEGQGATGTTTDSPFSWFEYMIFLLVGVAMLWAWNLFLAASPYFNWRFLSRPALARTFQSSVLTVSTVTNLVVTLILANLQRKANYAGRIQLALVINTAAFALLTLSTSVFHDTPADSYFTLILVDVCFAALATGLFQNGAFAFAASFGRSEYTQAIMAGQAVAGVLPALSQMISVLLVPPPNAGEEDNHEPGAGDTISTAAFIYFLTAVVVSLFTLASFLPLARRHRRLLATRAHEAAALDHQPTRKVVSLATLARKLHWPALSAAICFLVTLAFFPVFTAKILSVNKGTGTRLLEPEVFVPLGFFVWNLGDLVGRMFTGGAFNAQCRCRPAILFLVGVARFAFMPLYLLCNLHGDGAVVSSDVFYLLVVQLPFGISNGWLASNAMMAAPECVEESEREAAGGFMGLCLVAGLALGSVLSFTVTGI